MERNTRYRITRRQVVQGIAAATGCALFPAFAAVRTDGGPWERAAEIRRRVTPPVFPARDFLIEDFGAVANDGLAHTQAFEAAVSACYQAGGGRVVVPAGSFLTGPIHLRSNVNLHLSAGAELRFSQAPADYLPLVRTWFEGMELMNYSPFVYALEARNVAITGHGVLNGQADFENWWPWRGPRAWKGSKSGASTGWKEGMPYQKASRNLLVEMASQGMPVEQRTFGEGHYIRSAMVEFNRCRNVLVEGVTIRHAPFWSVHPVLSDNVTVRNLHIDNPVGANADGVDPEACSDVLIEDCSFDTGDDCISLKSGRDHDGRRLATPCQNVLISGCHFSSERSAVSCGSESSGGIRDVFIENIEAGRVFRLFRIKTNSRRGGVNERIHLRNARVLEALENLIEIQTEFSEPLKDAPQESAASTHYPIVRDICFTDIECGPVFRAFNLAGSPHTPIRNLSMERVHIAAAANPSIFSHLSDASAEQVTIGGREFRFP
jgi:polygalacturonase